MKDKVKGIAVALAAVAALAVGGAAIAGATGNDSSSSPSAESESADGPEGNDSSAPIDGSALDKASAAALESTGGGQVTETETGDEESYYEVEVTRDDGSQVDVQLDRQFNVVGSEADGSGDE